MKQFQKQPLQEIITGICICICIWQQPLQKIITGIWETISHKGKSIHKQGNEFSIYVYTNGLHLLTKFNCVFKMNYQLCTPNISTAQIWGPSAWKSWVAGFHLKSLVMLSFQWLKYCAVWTCVWLCMVGNLYTLNLRLKRPRYSRGRRSAGVLVKQKIIWFARRTM